MFPILNIAPDGHAAVIIIDHMARQLKRLHSNIYMDCWGNQYIKETGNRMSRFSA